MALDLIQTYKPELVKMMKQVLCDASAQATLDRYQTELNNIIIQIHTCESRNQQLGQKYNNLMNQLYSNVTTQSLSQINMIASQSASLDLQMQDIINKLFQKEHEILDYLTQGLAATTDYAIYFSTQNSSGQETVMRGQIKSEDLYNSGQLTITNQGIQLYHSKVVELFKTKGTAAELTPSQIAEYTKLAQTAIGYMKDALAQLKKELQGISNQKKREHLGGALWSKYQNLRRLVGNEYQEQGLEAAYLYGILNNADHYTSLRGSFMNRGHIYEALERYVQGDQGSLSELLGESIGHDPWWTQGDVGSIQVKSLVGNQVNYESFVKVASMDSILRVADMLQQLLNSREKENSQLNQRIDDALTAQIHGTADHSGIMINKVIQQLINEIHTNTSS